jgi:hypothetical protein
MPIVDLTGQVFSRLTVKSITDERYGPNVVWFCECDCGNTIKVSGYRLKSGNVKSCGCLRKETTIERSTKHGETANGIIHRDYHIWSSLKKRCYNKKSKYYKDYGGRGIKVHSEWKNDFAEFARYIRSLPNYPNPDKNTDITLDRIDNNKDYKPGNLKWSSKKEQANNRRSNIIVTYKGTKGTLKEIVEKFTSLPYSLVRSRVVDLKWSLKKALTTPSRIKNRRRKSSEL